MSGRILLDDPNHAGASTQLFLGLVPNDKTGTPAPTAGARLKQWAADVNAMTLEIYSALGCIYAINYGIDTTGVTACDAALNQAILDSITQKKKCILPNGVLFIANPLIGYTGIGSSVWIEGQGAGGVSSINLPATKPTIPVGAVVNNTIIVCGFSDRPAIIFNCNRYSRLQGISIMGQNVAPATQLTPPATPTPTNPPSSNKALYLTSGCRDSINSPYAGIAIDPFTVASPSDGGYPGMTASYNAGVGNGTYGLIIEDVNITQFVANVALATGGGTSALAADIVFRNVNNTNCVYNIVTCQGQADDVTVEYGNWTNSFCLIDGLSYGLGQGRPVTWKRVNFGFTYRLMNLSASIGNCVFDNCYGESLVSLGNFGTGASSDRSPLTFIGGDYHIQATAGWLIPPIMLESYGPTTFIGCSILNSSALAMDAWNFVSGATNVISFERCTITGPNTNGVSPLIGVSLDMQGGMVRLKDCWIHGSGATGFLLSDEYSRTETVASFAQSSRLNCRQETTWVPNGPTMLLLVPATLQPQITIAGCSAFALNTSTMTFTCSNAAFLMVGDILAWLMLKQGGSGLQYTLPALKITGISGTAITCSYLWDPAQYDTVTNYTASHATSMLLFPHRWAPTAALTCNIQADATLQSVSPTSILKNGDWIIGSSGIAANTRVQGGGGTGTITLNQPTNATASGVTIWYDRLNTVTTSPAF